jgi:hypothetical protein
MTVTRIAVAGGIALLTAFVVIVILAGPPGLGAAVGATFAIVALIAAGNLLYGRNSHYAAAHARMRPRPEPPTDPGGPDPLA